MLHAGVVYYVLVLRRNRANVTVGQHRIPDNSAGYNGYTHLAFLSLLTCEKSNTLYRHVSPGEKHVEENKGGAVLAVNDSVFAQSLGSNFHHYLWLFFGLFI